MDYNNLLNSTNAKCACNEVEIVCDPTKPLETPEKAPEDYWEYCLVHQGNYKASNCTCVGAYNLESPQVPFLYELKSAFELFYLKQSFSVVFYFQILAAVQAYDGLEAKRLYCNPKNTIISALDTGADDVTDVVSTFTVIFALGSKFL